MSNAEHLISNVIHMIDRGYTYDKIKERLFKKPDVYHMASVGISADDIVSMAEYIYYTMRPNWIDQGRQEIIDKHGYE